MTKDLHVHIGGNPPTAKDYEHLINKPQINGVELSGNKTMDDLRVIRSGNTQYWTDHALTIPEPNQIIIYTDKDIVGGVVYPGMKIGNGTQYVKDLPFIGDDITAAILEQLDIHAQDTDIHVTPEEKAEWNGKINCAVVGESLVFSVTQQPDDQQNNG